MANYTITLNGEERQITDLEPDTPLLWVLRDHLNLVGTKFGCGIAQCGSCTVHMNGSPTRSCIIPISAADGATVTTIEGLAGEGSLHPLQKAWIDLDVPQCGYCQAGQIMSAAALLDKNPRPSDEDIDRAMAGNISSGGMAQVIRSSMPSRFSPAQASTMAS